MLRAVDQHQPERRDFHPRSRRKLDAFSRIVESSRHTVTAAKLGLGTAKVTVQSFPRRSRKRKTAAIGSETFAPVLRCWFKVQVLPASSAPLPAGDQSWEARRGLFGFAEVRALRSHLAVNKAKLYFRLRRGPAPASIGGTVAMYCCTSDPSTHLAFLL